ncbi:MAG: hypothetical protein V3T23_13655 [Nitrososphaerales archaeon]
MANLFERLGLGVGKALTTLGTLSLESRRAERLEKIRSGEAKTEREFRISEREAAQKFRAGESKLTREATAAVDEVTDTKTDDYGNITTTYRSGRMELWTKATDKITVLGKGQPGTTDESEAEDLDWGKAKAARQAGWLSRDKSDFTYFKTEERAAEAAARFRMNARKAGTLDEFDTEFAKSGWKYIQELASGDKETGVAKPGKTKQPKKVTSLEDIFVGEKATAKSRQNEIAQDILDATDASDPLNKQARKFLSTAAPTAKAKPKKEEKFTDKENWWLDPGSLPIDARKEMTSEKWAERSKMLGRTQTESKAESKAAKEKSTKQAVEESKTVFPDLSKKEQAKWILEFIGFLSKDQRKELLRTRK